MASRAGVGRVLWRPGLTGHAGRSHYAPVHDQQQESSFSWLLAWLIFGVLAAREVGALAAHAGGDWDDLLSLAFLVGSVACLSVLLIGAVRHARPARAFAPSVVSFLLLFVCLWALYGPEEARSSSISTFLFGLAYSTICLATGLVALVVARHKRRAKDARIAEAHAEREWRRRMDGMRSETSAPMAAAAAAAAAPSTDESDPLGPDGDFVLPSRPKWEES